MEEIAKTIQCSNINCLVFNPNDNQFCHQCGTPIVRHYLYVLGEEIKSYQTEELLLERYLIQKPSLVLDTKPGVNPDLTEDIPPQIVPYLKLITHRLHIPQVYGFINLEEQQIWLLEYFTTISRPLPEMPRLTEVWSQATVIKQLHWLWQMAALWQPLYDEKVASSLCEPSLVRVKDNLIYLKELHLVNKGKTPLKLLGHFWSTLVQTADSTIKNLLETIAKAIINRQISESKQLLEILDQAIAEISKNQEYHYQICTYTDVGKTRDNNEDYCYPPSGTYLKIDPKEKNFAIVCDGIGGHEGGEVASQMTVDFLQAELTQIASSEEQINPETFSEILQQLTCAVNDIVSNRNNSESRFQQRQRMGTTLVMSFASNHEIYFSHVGDSRIYRISKQNCQQITVDDDLASRQVRLGYTIYRDALLYPGAGALIQALGMNPSISLHPTTQRYLISEDSVFLLCSDGLSDFDRVEQYWEQEILPILTESKNLSEVGKRLIEIANQTNGHDNITIALVYCQVISKPTNEKIICNYEELISSVKNLAIQEDQAPFIFESESQEQEKVEPVKTAVKTKQLSVPKKKKQAVSLDLILTIFIILGSIYLIYAWIFEPLMKPNLKSKISFENGKIIKIKENILLYSYPSEQQEKSPNYDGIGEVTQGSMLQVINRNDDNSWLEFKICYTSKSEILNQIPAGESGWIKNLDISNKIEPDFIADDVEQSFCNEKINLKLGDVIKITENMIINEEQLTEIKTDTLLKVKGITDDKSLIKFEFCVPTVPENSNQISPNETNFISTQELINKFDQANINSYSLENTTCNINAEPNINDN